MARKEGYSHVPPLKIPSANKKQFSRRRENPREKIQAKNLSPLNTTSHAYKNVVFSRGLEIGFRLCWPRSIFTPTIYLHERERAKRRYRSSELISSPEKSGKEKESQREIRTYLAFRREPSTDWPTRRAAARVDRARHPISSSLFRIASSAVAAFTLLSPPSSPLILRPHHHHPSAEPSVLVPGWWCTPSPEGKKRSVWRGPARSARVLITWLITPARQIAVGW